MIFRKKMGLVVGMTGPSGGSWYPLGEAIAVALQKEISGVTVSFSRGGGITNIEGVEYGKCDLAFSNSSSVMDGVHGRPPFERRMETLDIWLTFIPSISRWSYGMIRR